MPHAIVVHRSGEPDVLEWRPVDVAAPGPGEVRLRHAAVGLNYIDVYHRTGYYEVPAPFTPGVEGAGTIEAVGAGVDWLHVGDRVAYAGPIGAYAEVRLAPADRMVRLPDSVSFEQAAAVMLQGMTACVLLRQTYRVQPGDTILVHAAAGGVGLKLCQWASALGATVIGTVSTQAKAELARAHGCQYPVVTDRDDFVKHVLGITGGAKLPVVYDSVGRDTFAGSLECLRPRGLMVSFGQSSGPVDPIAPVLLAEKGSLYLTRPSLFSYIASRCDLEATAQALFAAIAAGDVPVAIHHRYPLQDAAAAHRDLEARRTTGSVVLAPSCACPS